MSRHIALCMIVYVTNKTILNLCFVCAVSPPMDGWAEVTATHSQLGSVHIKAVETPRWLAHWRGTSCKY